MHLEDAKGAKDLIPKYTDTVLILSILKSAIELDTTEDYNQLL
jgi:hypothetical protein